MSLFRIVKNWKSGSYREVPWNTVVLATGAIIHFLRPVDLIPDVVPCLGLVVDMARICCVMRAIHSDMEKFRVWQQAAPQLEPTAYIENADTSEDRHAKSRCNA